MFRNPFEFRLRLLLAVFIAVVLGLLFLRLEYNQQAAQNMSAIIFMMIINLSFVSVQANADVIQKKIVV
jgi:ABC-2 type transporter